MPTFSNRKKVRGWKRRLRQLERFRLAHRTLDVEALRQSHYHYVKVWLDPWSRLGGRNPPIWFRRRILAALMDIHDAWRAALEGLGEPYYLEVWLFHPDCYRSQVVAGLDWRMEHYRNVFPPAADAATRPLALYDDPAYDLDHFAWRPGTDENVYMACPGELDADAKADFERRASHVEQAANGDALYFFELGTVWQGALADPSTPSPDPAP
ncbi:MAG TPA: hypothetical protein VF142_05720 [Longimicrobium sp.]